MTKSEFVGRQLSRLKMGLIYYTMIMGTFTALSVVKMAFPDLSTWVVFALSPLAFVGAFLVGYIMDKSNVITSDYQKTLDMQHRYMNITDRKNNDFRMVMMKGMESWFKSIQDGTPINSDVLDEKNKKFLEKWSPKNGDETAN